MKKKWFIPLALVAMLSVGAYAQQTDDQECPDDGGGGGGTSCTVTSKCYGLFSGEEGSVSCTGSSCERGTGYVMCDGVKTKC